MVRSYLQRRNPLWFLSFIDEVAILFVFLIRNLCRADIYCIGVRRNVSIVDFGAAYILEWIQLMILKYC